MTPVSCPHCGTPLDLDGLCPKCVALEFLTPLPPTAVGRMADAPASGEHLRYFGDYEILNEIAHGGMGVVYRARQVSLDRVVAVKMLLVSPRLDPSFRERFHAEAHAAASLHHPGIVTVHEVGEHEGMPYFSMDYVAGKTLAELTRDGALPARVAAEYLLQAAAAVQHAHERGIIHRDLKPSNVMVDENGKVRVTDFGLAKRLDVGSDLTLTGHLIGTPGYMAPEQGARTALSASSGAEEILADKAVRAPAVAADVYSLGATLYHLLTGRAPFTGSSAGDILRQVAESDPIPPAQLNPSVPRDLETITLKCLEKETSRRYTSAAELAEELGRFLRGEPIHARPASPAEKLWRWSRRQPALAAALAACALILVAGIAGILWQLRETEAARADAEQKARDEQEQRTLAQRSELVMRQNLYAADMLGAQRALEQNDLGTARKLLDTHRPAAGQTDLRGFEWRYFWAQSRSDCFAVLTNKSDYATTVSYSADGAWLAFGSQEVFVCDATSLKILARTEVSSVQSLAFTPDGEALFIGDRATNVLRWAWRREDQPSPFCEAQGNWPNVAVSPAGDLIAVGCGANRRGDTDGTTTLRDATTGAIRWTLPEAGGVAAFSPDGKHLVTGQWQGTLKVWDSTRGTAVGVLTNATMVVSLTFSPDGNTLAMCSFADGLSFYELATGTRHPGPHGHTSRVWDAAFSPDGTHIATCSADLTVRVWAVNTGRETARFRGHSFDVQHVAWSPGGKAIASGGNDGTVRLWNAEAARAAVPPVQGWLTRRFFSSDGRWIAIGQPGNSTRVRDYPDLNPVSDTHAPGWPLGFLRDTNVLATIAGDGKFGEVFVSFWAIPEFRLLRKVTLPDSAGQLLPWELAHNSRFLAIGFQDGSVRIWDLNEGTESHRWAGRNTGRVNALSFSPDDRLLAAVLEGSTSISLWDLTSGEHSELRGHTGYPFRLVFSPDGRTLISGGSDKQIKLWSIAERKEVATLSGHREGVIALDVSPDGKTLVSGGNEFTLHYWHLPTRREMVRYPMEKRVVGLTFAPDGNALLGVLGAPAETNSSVRVWSAPAFVETDASSNSGIGP